MRITLGEFQDNFKYEILNQQIVWKHSNVAMWVQSFSQTKVCSWEAVAQLSCSKTMPSWCRYINERDGIGLHYSLSNRVPLYARKSHRLPFYYCRCLQNCHPILYKKWLSTALKRNIELFYRTIIHGFTFDVIKTKPCHCLHKAKAKISSKRKEIFRFSFACFVYFVYFCHQYVNLITMIFWQDKN